MTSLDTFQRFRTRLQESKNSVDSQVSLSPWSFSVDANDNLVIKNGNTVHTTIAPNGDITTSSVNIPNGPSLAGNSVTGLTDRDILSAPHTVIAGLSNAATATATSGPEVPLGYVTMVSSNGLWMASSDGIDGGVVYGRVVVHKVRPSMTQVAALTPPSGTTNATMFGSAIHINSDGSRIYVGEPGLDQVHVYLRNKDGSWSLEHTITGPNSAALFGSSLAVASDTFVVVGAPATSSNVGAIHIYERSSASWTLKWTLNGNSSISDYQLGTNVAISIDTNTIVASAVGSSALYSSSGTVEVYTKGSSSVWVRTKSIVTPVTPGPSTLFGGAIEISDNSQYIFIADAEMPVGVASGSVYVYGASNGDWVLLSTLSAGRNTNARFGWSVKERNGILLVGAPGDDNGGANANAGYATMYKLQRNEWTLSNYVAPPSVSTGAFFGWSVSMATSDLLTISMPYLLNGSVFYYEPTSYLTAGTITKTHNLSAHVSHTYDVGSFTEPYGDLYLQNAPTVTSDLNEKKNVRDVERDIEFVNKLQPVTFKWRHKNDGTHIGFIGQQVAAISNTAGVAPVMDGHHLLRPHEFISPLVKSCQQISARLDLLKPIYTHE